ncbi:LOW QUALITY PROTEIN: RE1-silencing transcription factor-like [Coregonus clupeaformis]|uniref:LOW QUALITY PROTEIN: RE1-silencing transcription factor-like n=1 Tax=Coregonus clupeaformis TaxID=59861 RepID=UPI001E1C5978|nr:LOW QUALITY PROTEIN: RE1-silencing transcription factor-like [Coregonus clupeaformis]
MASQTVYPMGLVMFSTSVGMPMVEDAQGLAELPHNELPAPQLVMLANVACENQAEGKEMMELQTVGSYSDSEDENIIRYSYDSHEREMCIVDYPESPRAALTQVEEIDVEEEGIDLSKPSDQRPSSPFTPSTPSTSLGMIMESAKKKKPFFCKPCNYQAQCEEEFVTHIKIHSANRMIVVKRMVGDKARAKETLAGPDQEAESGDGGANNKGLIRCERCGYNTNRYDHYMAHLKHHEKEGDDQRVYKCTICTYTTVSQYHWKKHLRNHFPSKLFTCNQCCYFSDRKNNYVQHIRTHTGERPFRCPYCEYSSSQKTHLTRHMRTHSGERPFKCDRCNYLAANQHEVTRHSRQVHNGPKPLCCPHCPYKTADRSNYKKHVELHLNPRQFLCPVCKYAASKKCNLQYHIKSRHPGCPQIAMDVSKVKLRVKKPDSDEFTDEYTMVNGIAKFELSAIDDDAEEGPEISGADKQSSPINLSTKRSIPSPVQAAESVSMDKTPKKCDNSPVKETKKSSKPSRVQAVESMATDKTPKKCDVSPVKETPKKAKEKAEKKVTLKRKSTEMGSENTKQNVTLKESGKETAAAVEIAGNKVKRSPKKQMTGKTSVQDKSEIKETVEKVQKAGLEEDNVEKAKSVKDRLEKETLERENMEKVKEDNKRLERKNMEKAKEDNKRLERENMEKAKEDNKRLERENMEKVKEDNKRLERENMEKVKEDNKRLERKNMEKVKEDNKRLERENMEKVKEDNKRLERENMEKVKEDNKRLERENMEKVKEDNKRLERKNMEKVKEDNKRLERENMEKVKEDNKRLERENMEKVKEDNKRLERENMEKVKEDNKRLERKNMEKVKEDNKRLERENMEKVKEDNKRLEREKKEQLEKLKNEKEGKENKNAIKSQNTTSKKIEKVVEKTVQKAPQSQGAPVQKQGYKSKTKPVKRKATEALDLSMKESPESCTNIKAKRLKIKPADKSQSKASTPRSRTTEHCPASEQKDPANQIMYLPVVKKLKETEKSNKKEASPGETEASSENKEFSIIDNPISPPESKTCPATELQPTVVQEEQQESDQEETVPALDTSTGQSPAEERPNNGENNLALQNVSPTKDTTPRAEQAKVAEKAEETPEGFSSTDESPSHIESDVAPDFRLAQGQPSTPTTPSLELPRPRGKPSETEEDEGIHSHDGGSEISDSASEGSDDSGLNGLAAAAGKLANDPETPTEEIPTPTELKSHMCVFCDRTFPLEAEFRRHLNRHLVNVYYL